MTLTINDVDFMPFVAREGYRWQHSDIDSSDAGRTMNGSMQRARVARKVRLDITLRPLTLEECSEVFTALSPVWLTVTYTDPELGEETTKTMYTNNLPAAYAVQHKDADDNITDWWDGVSFPLIER